MYRMLCILLASILLLQPTLYARAAAKAGLRPQESSAQKPTVKEKLVSLPAQSFVEVRLRDKSKLRGRLGQITDEGFAVQVAQGNKIQNVNVSFDQVKSVKLAENKGTSTGRVVLYALAGIGALLMVMLIWAIASSGSE